MRGIQDLIESVSYLSFMFFLLCSFLILEWRRFGGTIENVLFDDFSLLL